MTWKRSLVLAVADAAGKTTTRVVATEDEVSPGFPPLPGGASLSGRRICNSGTNPDGKASKASVESGRGG